MAGSPPAAPLSPNSGADPSTRGSGPGAITRLILEPIEAIGAGHIQYGLWGSDGQDDQRAGWAFARVQGLLGPGIGARAGALGRPERVGSDHPGAVGG